MEALELLMAERDIHRQLLNYCRSMDRCDAALGYAVFHPDAVLDYGDEIYRGNGNGFIDWAMEAHTHLEHHQHRLSNVLITVDGEDAGSESYVEAVFRLTVNGVAHEMRSLGRYVDRWQKRDGRWAISQRAYLHTTDTFRALENEPRPITGTRAADDPSYAVLS
jgi:hypothetical protein